MKWFFAVLMFSVVVFGAKDDSPKKAPFDLQKFVGKYRAFRCVQDGQERTVDFTITLALSDDQTELGLRSSDPNVESFGGFDNINKGKKDVKQEIKEQLERNRDNLPKIPKGGMKLLRVNRENYTFENGVYSKTESKAVVKTVATYVRTLTYSASGIRFTIHGEGRGNQSDVDCLFTKIKDDEEEAR
jgi:hypothetical protein